jgi:signal transduction histidine kinase
MMRRVFFAPGLLVVLLFLATAPYTSDGREVPVAREHLTTAKATGWRLLRAMPFREMSVRIAPHPLNAIVAQLRSHTSVYGAANTYMTEASPSPTASEIAVAQPAWRRRYFWRFVVTLLIILGQGILITKLLMEFRGRRSAERTLQRHLIEATRASRLAVAGELTASIAHEIRQPLAAILSNTETAELMLQSEVDLRESLRPILADIRRDDLRASEVIRRLRTLLASNEVERNPIDLNAVVADVCALLQDTTARRGVRIEKREHSVAQILGDRVQIQQVLINLVMNAMDAVEDMSEERRTILVSVTSAERRCTIKVRDLGHGIRANELPNLFISFYSSKRAGMGLGLSIARTIVESHGGYMEVTSRPGEGSEFRASFPSIQSIVQELRA